MSFYGQFVYEVYSVLTTKRVCLFGWFIKKISQWRSFSSDQNACIVRLSICLMCHICTFRIWICSHFWCNNFLSVFNSMLWQCCAKGLLRFRHKNSVISQESGSCDSRSCLDLKYLVSCHCDTVKAQKKRNACSGLYCISFNSFSLIFFFVFFSSFFFFALSIFKSSVQTGCWYIRHKR